MVISKKHNLHHQLHCIDATYNDGFRPDIILLLLLALVLPSRNPIECHKEVLSSQPIMFPHLSVLTNLPPCLGCVQIFLQFFFFLH